MIQVNYPLRELSQLSPYHGCTMLVSGLGLLALLGGRLLLLGAGHLLCQDLLDALLFLDQERSDHTCASTAGTTRATICAVDTALALLQAAILDGAQGRHTDDSLTTVTALWCLRR